MPDTAYTLNLYDITLFPGALEGQMLSVPCSKSLTTEPTLEDVGDFSFFLFNNRNIFLSVEKRFIMKYGNDLQKSVLNDLNHHWTPLMWLPGTVLNFHPRNASARGGLTGWGKFHPTSTNRWP